MQVIKRLRFILVLSLLLAAASEACATEYVLVQAGVKKGSVSVKVREGVTFVALDQMLNNLGFLPRNQPGLLTTTYGGVKLEFWSGSNVARVGGTVFTFPANVYPEGGAWWGEETYALRVMEQFLRAAVLPAELRWANAGESAGSVPVLTPPAPPVAVPPMSSHGTAMLSGVRWGLQADSHRAVVDISAQTNVTLKESSGNLEITFADTSASSAGEHGSPWPPLAVNAKNAANTAVLSFAHNAPNVKSFWLSDPPRYVVDFYFSSAGAAVTPPPTQVSEHKPVTAISTVPSVVNVPHPPASNGFLVVVDAGHGGHDPGAVGNGLKEKDINLKAALQLAERLKKLGLDVRLSRADDRYLKLAERTAFANNANADIFISLHCNALPKGKHATGMELYLMAEPSDKDAMDLAVFENRELAGQGQSTTEATAAADEKTKLLLKILGDMQQNDKISESTTLAEFLYKRTQNAGISLRKVRQAPFFVLRGAGMPAVLVEMGYISEKTDSQLLNSEAFRGKMMDNLAAGVLDYLSKMQKGGRR